MSKRLGVFCLLFMLMSCAATPVQAQFWKNWFKSADDEPRRKPVSKPKPKEPAKEPAKAKKKSQKIEYPATVIKDRYRVDVLASFYLDELVQNNKPVFKDKAPDKALTSINFYEGVKLAADSLTKLGYKLDVYVHDITQSALTPDALVKSDALAESDLIIGLLQYNQLQVMAGFAKKHHINFISALSPSDGDVKDNPYFTLLQPTLETHCRHIKEQVLSIYKNKQVTVCYRTNVSVDSLAYHYTGLDQDNKVMKLSLNTVPAKEVWDSFLDSLEDNVIVMPVVDVNAAEQVLEKLSEYFPAYRIEVYGMPSWKSLPGLRKTDAYPNIAVDFSSPFYVDQSIPVAQAVSNAYKKEFGGRPNELVFRGYETLFWYANLLQRYGTIFNQKQGDTDGAIFTRYDVKTQWTKQQDLLYNENEHIYLYKYQGGSFMVTP